MSDVMQGANDLPQEAYAATLAGLGPLGPARLERLLGRWSPSEAWAAVKAGRATGMWGRGEAPATVRKAEEAIARAIATADPARSWARCQAASVAVLLHGATDYPAVLADDLSPPPVLFARGDVAALDGRRVTIVGTRSATAAGREVAAELGAGLAQAGVRVVSGLARGIDGWAHRGALSAAGGGPPIGVVASGPDVVYPPEHRPLWDEVVERGVLLSEVPPGTAPHALRFPLRNRILAALGEVIVVVESKRKGGSLITVEEALLRGRRVFAVPGSPRNEAAEGTNDLLIDGADPVVRSADLLMALGFERPVVLPTPEETGSRVAPADRWMLQLLGAEPRHLDTLVQLSGRSLAEVASTLGRLTDSGAVCQLGGWFERRTRSVGRHR
jgi:DNA processing protein